VKAIPLLLVACVLAAGAVRGAGIEAIARPSDDRTLSFTRPGQIAEVAVKDGDRVRKGQLLVRLDDEAEQAQLEQLKAQAADTSRIEAAKAQAQQRKVELGRLKAAERPDLELDRARLEVTIAELSIKLAELEQRQDARKVKESAIYIQRMRLLSPIDGLVEKTFLRAGEAADKLRPIIRLVNIDPLRIDVAVPRKQAAGLKVGGAAGVRFADAKAPAGGKITFIAAEVDAASGTLTVRVELPNSQLRRAGTHVWVSFPNTD
jgi:RND family efflux transporter MFP subunit